MPRRPKTPFEEQCTGRKSQARAAAIPEAAVEAGTPRMPSYMTGVAKERWRELIRILKRRGVLTLSDGPMIELSCNTYQRLRAAEEDVAKNGIMVTVEWEGRDGNVFTKQVVNPAAKLVATYESQVRAQLKELATTVLSRDSVKPAPTPEGQQPLKEDAVGRLYPGLFQKGN